MLIKSKKLLIAALAAVSLSALGVCAADFVAAPRVCFAAPASLGPRDWADRGHEAYRNKDYQLAVSHYTNAIELDPENENYYYSRARSYNQLKKYAEAVEDATKAIYLSERADQRFYNTRGFAYKELKQYDEAIEDFSVSLELEPSATVYYNRAKVYNLQKRYSEAVEDCTRALALKKVDVYYDERAYAYKRLDMAEEAISDYTESIRLKPNSWTYNQRGNVYYDMLKQYQKALSDYSQAIKLKPKAEYYTNSAKAYFCLGLDEAALAECEAALALDDKYERALKVKHGIQVAVNLKRQENSMPEKTLQEVFGAADWYQVMGGRVVDLRTIQSVEDTYRVRCVDRFKLPDGRKVYRSFFYMSASANNEAAIRYDEIKYYDIFSGEFIGDAERKDRETTVADDEFSAMTAFFTKVKEALRN